MSTSCEMYKLKPLIDTNAVIKCSSNMYKLKNIHDTENLVLQKNGLEIKTQNDSENSELISNLEKRQENILKHLGNLQGRINCIKSNLQNNSQMNDSNTEHMIHSNVQISSYDNEAKELTDIIIKASPAFIPYSLLLLKNFWKKYGNIELNFNIFYHSSINENERKQVEQFSKQLMQKNQNSNEKVQNIDVIWKNVESNLEFILRDKCHVPIVGEINVIRYLSRLGPVKLNYEKCTRYEQINNYDLVLDTCHSLFYSESKTEKLNLLKTLNQKLGKNEWFCNGEVCSVVDVAAFSIIKKIGCMNELTQNLTKWFKKCESLLSF